MEVATHPQQPEPETTTTTTKKVLPPPIITFYHHSLPVSVSQQILDTKRRNLLMKLSSCHPLRGRCNRLTGELLKPTPPPRPCEVSALRDPLTADELRRKHKVKSRQQVGRINHVVERNTLLGMWNGLSGERRVSKDEWKEFERAVPKLRRLKRKHRLRSRDLESEEDLIRKRMRCLRDEVLETTEQGGGNKLDGDAGIRL